MAIYFDGFDDKMLSFYSESGRVGRRHRENVDTLRIFRQESS